METAQLPALKGRPREFDVDEALAAALRVFWRKGFEAASMTDLTDAMGVTRPSLYAAFGNKESLFRKALDLYEREKLAYVEMALAAPTARQVAERLLRGALDIATSSCDPKGCLGVVSTVACSEYAPSIKQEVLARRQSSETALIQRFERARDSGDLPPAIDPTGLARYVFAIMQGLAVQASGGTSREDLERLIDTSLAVWPSA
jgi:AcrR family transcriptional regulator